MAIRMDDSGTRPGIPWRAFLLSPLGAAMVLSMWGAWSSVPTKGLSDVPMLLLLFAIFSYAAALVTGLPLFLIVRRMGWMSRIACVLAAGLAGFVFFVGMFSIDYGLSNTLATRGSEQSVRRARQRRFWISSTLQKK